MICLSKKWMQSGTKQNPKAYNFKSKGYSVAITSCIA